MWVCLTPSQSEFVYQTIGDSRRHWIMEERIASKRSTFLRSPAVAWENIARVFGEQAYDTTVRIGPPTARQRSALVVRRIARALNAAAMHPALRNWALPGWSPEVFAVWSIEADEFGRVWSMVPVGDVEMQILYPRLEGRSGATITVWRTDPVPGTEWVHTQPMYSEMVHRAAASAFSRMESPLIVPR
jgi:hypothetical protein